MAEGKKCGELDTASGDEDKIRLGSHTEQTRSIYDCRRT